jgi:hypothetical protein
VRRRLLAAAALAALTGSAVPAALAAQSSQFGVRGLGIPGRPVSARSLGMGGANALLDPETSINPASLGSVSALTASFSGLQNYRWSENAAADLTARETRFPQTLVAGPIRAVPLSIGIGFSSYAVRDFRLGSQDTLTIRGVPVAVNDTFTSRGGLTDVRLGVAYRLPGALHLGVGLHAITGVNRLEIRRVFGDSAYRPISENADVSYTGLGLSVGVAKAWRGFALGAFARTDGHVDVEQDSTDRGRIELPYSVGLGFRWLPAARLELAGQGIVRTWRDANRDLLDRGGTGSDNTVEVALGGQLVRNRRDPTRLPIRFGGRYATLPFPLEVGGTQPRELGVTLGTGIGFARDDAGVPRARIDLGLEHVWRRAGEGFTERALLVGLGVSLRP